MYLCLTALIQWNELRPLQPVLCDGHFLKITQCALSCLPTQLIKKLIENKTTCTETVLLFKFKNSNASYCYFIPDRHIYMHAWLPFDDILLQAVTVYTLVGKLKPQVRTCDGRRRGLAASHSYEGPSFMVYCLFPSPHWNSVNWWCKGRAKKWILWSFVFSAYWLMQKRPSGHLLHVKHRKMLPFEQTFMFFFSWPDCYEGKTIKKSRSQFSHKQPSNVLWFQLFEEILRKNAPEKGWCG